MFSRKWLIVGIVALLLITAVFFITKPDMFSGNKKPSAITRHLFLTFSLNDGFSFIVSIRAFKVLALKLVSFAHFGNNPHW